MSGCMHILMQLLVCQCASVQVCKCASLCLRAVPHHAEQADVAALLQDLKEKVQELEVRPPVVQAGRQAGAAGGRSVASALV
jgi:hypothetical protein